MKLFEMPKIEVTMFDVQDVITTSSDDDAIIDAERWCF